MAIALGIEIFSESEWKELVSNLFVSPRQAQVIRYLLSGHSDKQIALEMQISVAGVRAHIGRLFSKFDLRDRLELVLYVFKCFREECRANGCPRFQ
jgi:DNA-binding NarL/FixJ family response regulator